jgi:hypothetical protein
MTTPNRQDDIRATLAAARVPVEVSPAGEQRRGFQEQLGRHTMTILYVLVGVLLAVGLVVITQPRQAGRMPAAENHAAAAFQPTSSPAPSVTPSATLPPTATPFPALPPGLVLYWGPNGDVATTLAQGTEAYTVTARYLEWLQVDVTGYPPGLWTRSEIVAWIDVDALPAPYQPTPTPEPVVIVKQAPAPAPVVLDCTPERAKFWASRSSAWGSAQRFSCESQAQADARAEAAIQEINEKAGQK